MARVARVARVLCNLACRYMRNEALNHKFVYSTPIQTSRLIADVADMHQRATQTYVRRPYGVGLLVASFDVRTPRAFSRRVLACSCQHAAPSPVHTLTCSARAHICIKPARTATTT
ncbi:hypothetical protein EON67_10890, partial [archaeon]